MLSATHHSSATTFSIKRKSKLIKFPIAIHLIPLSILIEFQYSFYQFLICYTFISILLILLMSFTIQLLIFHSFLVMIFFHHKWLKFNLLCPLTHRNLFYHLIQSLICLFQLLKGALLFYHFEYLLFFFIVIAFLYQTLRLMPKN